MSADIDKGHPAPSVRRLPMYLHYLRELRNTGKKNISCTHIANDLGLVPVQVRKDLAITKIVGRPKTGYELLALIDAIEDFLGWNTPHEALLLGVGCLGSAVLGYDGFAEEGLKIVAAFDTDPKKIGETIVNTKVYRVDKIQEIAEARSVQIGILTVPGDVAQQSANALVEAGVRAIWNYTPVKLELPDTVVCEDVRLSSSLALLTSRLKGLCSAT